MPEELKQAALEYHRKNPPGKLAIQATKPMTTQYDLSLAYSPGVAVACEAIADNPTEAYELTARGNLVGVITNGTAVLGLGAIGALASKPVMEGKAVLFKKFADIDVFDIEVEEQDPEQFINIVSGLEATFGGINLEDIKAPECFVIEEALRERMNIPVFHDDQHGTAIVAAAALTNALEIVGKKAEDVKVVASGAGAAALSCLNMMVNLGVKLENIIVTDIHGVVYKGRKEDMDPYKERYAVETDKRTLSEVIKDADVFLGLSAGGVLKAEMVETMGDKPIILALANPNPEIMPDEVKAVRPDAVIATGRSDFPNQVNNVLCFPFIFRGALDVGATEINEEMKVACAKAIAELARAESIDEVAEVYKGQSLTFGPEYILPKPFDPRLIMLIPEAVAKAAMETGVATRPIKNFFQYRQRLSSHISQSSNVMQPIFEKVREDLKTVVYAEGEADRVLRAVQLVVDEQVAKPVLIGRSTVVEEKIHKLGLRMQINTDFSLIEPLVNEELFEKNWNDYHDICARQGVTPSEAKRVVQTNNTVIAALMVRRGDADAMICGQVGRWAQHLAYLERTIGKAKGTKQLSTIVAFVHEYGMFFICDAHVTPNPTAEEIAETTLMAAKEVSHFGITPKIALCSHSNFGTRNNESTLKMREALTIVRDKAPELEVDGEMWSESALTESIRNRTFPNSTLTGIANLLVMPNLDAANISAGLLRVFSNSTTIGPILVGTNKPAHIVTQSTTVRGFLNLTAIAAAQAGLLQE